MRPVEDHVTRAPIGAATPRQTTPCFLDVVGDEIENGIETSIRRDDTVRAVPLADGQLVVSVRLITELNEACLARFTALSP